jgi:site-specific DNA-cytosine methylase
MEEKVRCPIIYENINLTKSKMKLKMLDLFSGIVGFSYALHDIAKTKAYCDIDPDCQQVLKQNMLKQNISKAKIHSDIRTFSYSHPVDMITAGFPCTDISAAKVNGQGLSGSHSSLFYEVLRIVDNLPSIKLVFLENSAYIRTRGLDEIRKELEKRYFKLVWTYLEACSVGAHHRRKRWYCLAYRTTALPLHPVSLLPMPSLSQPTLQKRDTNDKQSLKRCMMLGNSVVPQAVQYAWNVLSQAAKENKTGAITSQTHRCENNPITLFDGSQTIRKHMYMTPTYNIWHQYKHLTSRAQTTLANTIYYDKHAKIDSKIPINERSRFYRINPKFIEQLMGYKVDWTFTS